MTSESSHRDVKPANILLDNRCREGVYLCDFGLGRDLDVATSRTDARRRRDAVYMAPERLLRFVADEIKCDIYSMGVTLCEALTLNGRFRSPTICLFRSRAVLGQGRAGASARARSGFPEELEAIIMKAMARDPRQRHDSAA